MRCDCRVCRSGPQPATHVAPWAALVPVGAALALRPFSCRSCARAATVALQAALLQAALLQRAFDCADDHFIEAVVETEIHAVRLIRSGGNANRQWCDNSQRRRQFCQLMFASPFQDFALCSASIGLNAFFCLLTVFRVRDSRR